MTIMRPGYPMSRKVGFVANIFRKISQLGHSSETSCWQCCDPFIAEKTTPACSTGGNKLPSFNLLDFEMIWSLFIERSVFLVCSLGKEASLREIALCIFK